jgi:acyl-CoA hydrolase
MHTELCSDAYYEMFKAGKLTNRRKSIFPGKGMAGIVFGSQELYDWVDNNPSIMIAPLEYVNAPSTIARLDNMVSINNCIAVDLYGQICAESAGLRHISGTGGQLDYVTGAAMARGGKAFICMTSYFINKEGKRESRILPHFAGDIVTAPRSQAHFIVTEYGAVNLAGKSTWERAEMLVSIAHPEFRDGLIRAADEQKIWRQSNKR